MQTWRFKLVPSRSPDVFRVVELTDAQTLEDLHGVLQAAFELDDDHLYAFYLSNVAWDRATEYSSHRGGRPGRRADEAVLRDLGLRVGRRFRYIFDFGDELWHEIEVVGTNEAEHARSYPWVVERGGPAPPQYPHTGDEDDVDEPPAAGDLDALATEMEQLTDELGESGDPPPTAWLDRAEAFARRLCARAAGEPGTFSFVGDAAGLDVVPWLRRLLLDLEDAGRFGAATELASAAEDIAAAYLFRSDRARVLARAGRAEEARALLEANLRDYADELGVSILAAEAFAVLGDSARAEALYRAALARAGDNVRARGEVVEALGALLEAQGRRTELAALQQEEAAVRARARAAWARGVAGRGLDLPAAPQPPVKRAEPKVGRNDPCPCGSGKKYKKCHGA